MRRSPRSDVAQGQRSNDIKDGQTLIKVGDRDFKFFVVASGEIEVLDESGETSKTIATLRRGEFTGDVAHLTGGPSLVSAIVRGAC